MGRPYDPGMSAVSTASVGAPALGASHAWLRPRVVTIAALVLAGVAITVVLAGDVLVRTEWFALFSAYNVLAFALAGLLWLKRRPLSHVGPVLLVLAVIAGLMSLQGSSSSLAFSIGVLADPFAALLAWYLFLSFPSGRLTRPAAAIMVFAVGFVATAFVPWFFLSEHVAGATPLARCTAGCPTNALMIANRPDVAGHFGTIEQILAVTFAAAAVVLLLVRFAIASPVRRRGLAPVAVVGIVWLGAFGAYQVAAYLVVTDMSFWNTVGWVLTGARIALPLAFLVALALAQMYAGGALERMMRLRVRPGVGELEQVAAEALGDPAFRLARWNPGAEAWIGTNGVVEPAPGRAWLELRSDGCPIAALDYDDVLNEDPELVNAAATAIRLSLDTTRLYAEKREMTAQLHEAQRRASTAGLSERRRLERDLHDGAQQQLIAARIQLSLLSERDGGNGMSEELDQLGRELDDALDEIRAIAHSTYPALLRTEGLRAALAHSVDSDPRARLECGALHRHTEAVEVAIYFSALEALQNASKHCPPGTDITVRLWEESSRLSFEVTDDGPGFDPTAVSPFGGLAGISDRMAAAGGTLAVDSAPGRGTRIAGSAGPQLS